MARPNQDLVAKDDVPWYLKYGGRLLGIVAAFCKLRFLLRNSDMGVSGKFRADIICILSAAELDLLIIDFSKTLHYCCCCCCGSSVGG